MTRIPFAILAAAPVVAQAATDVVPGVGPFMQYGSFGVICFVVGWMFTRQIPAQAKENQIINDKILDNAAKAMERVVADQKAERDMFEREMSASREEHRREMAEMHARLNAKDEQIIQLLRADRQKP